MGDHTGAPNAHTSSVDRRRLATSGFDASVDFPALWYATVDQLQRCIPFIAALKTSLAAVQAATTTSWSEQNDALMGLLDCVQMHQDLLAVTTSISIFLHSFSSSGVSSVSPKDRLTASAARSSLTLSDVVLAGKDRYAAGPHSNASKPAPDLPKKLRSLSLHLLDFPYTEFCATIWLAFDARYPAGVQRRALEVLELYASRIVGEEGWRQAREKMLQQSDFGFEDDDVSYERTIINEAFPLLLVGVLQLLPQCSMQIKSFLLDYIETVLLFLSPSAVAQSVEGLLVAVLPLLEEAEGSELHRRGMRILACVRRKVSSSQDGPRSGTALVYAVLWRLLVEAPMLSGGVWAALSSLAQLDHTLFSVEEQEHRSSTPLPSFSPPGGTAASPPPPRESGEAATPLRVLHHLQLCGGDPQLVYWGIFYTLLSSFTNGGSGAGRPVQSQARTLRLMLDFLLEYLPLHTFLTPPPLPPPQPSLSMPITLPEADSRLVELAGRGLPGVSPPPPRVSASLPNLTAEEEMSSPIVMPFEETVLGTAADEVCADDEGPRRTVLSASVKRPRHRQSPAAPLVEQPPFPRGTSPALAGNRIPKPDEGFEGGPQPLFQFDEVALLVASAVQLIAAPTTQPNVARRLMQWIQSAYRSSRGFTGEPRATAAANAVNLSELQDENSESQVSDGSPVMNTATENSEIGFPAVLFSSQPEEEGGDSSSSGTSNSPPHWNSAFPPSHAKINASLVQHRFAGAYLIVRAFCLMTEWWTSKGVADDVFSSPLAPWMPASTASAAVDSSGGQGGARTSTGSLLPSLREHDKNGSSWEILQESAAHSLQTISNTTSSAHPTSAATPSHHPAASVSARSVYPQAALLPSLTSKSSTGSVGTPSLGRQRPARSVRGGASRLLVAKPVVTGGAGVALADNARVTLVSRKRQAALPHLWYNALCLLTSSIDPHVTNRCTSSGLSGGIYPSSTSSVVGTEEMPFSPHSPLGVSGEMLSHFLMKNWSALLGAPLCTLLASTLAAPGGCDGCEEMLLRQLGWQWLADLHRSLLRSMSQLWAACSPGFNTTLEGVEDHTGASQITALAPLMRVWDSAHRLWFMFFIPQLIRDVSPQLHQTERNESAEDFVAEDSTSSPTASAPRVGGQAVPRAEEVKPTPRNVKLMELMGLFDFAVEVGQGLLQALNQMLANASHRVLRNATATQRMVQFLEMIYQHFSDVFIPVLVALQDAQRKTPEFWGWDPSTVSPASLLLSQQSPASILKPLLELCDKAWRTWVLEELQSAPSCTATASSIDNGWWDIAAPLKELLDLLLPLVGKGVRRTSPCTLLATSLSAGKELVVPKKSVDPDMPSPMSSTPQMPKVSKSSSPQYSKNVPDDVTSEVFRVMEQWTRDTIDQLMHFVQHAPHSAPLHQPVAGVTEMVVECTDFLFTTAEALSRCDGGAHTPAGDERWWWRSIAERLVPVLWSQLPTRGTLLSRHYWTPPCPTSAQEGFTTTTVFEEALEEEVLSTLLRGALLSAEVLAALNGLVYHPFGHGSPISPAAFLSPPQEPGGLGHTIASTSSFQKAEEDHWTTCERTFRLTEYVLRLTGNSAIWENVDWTRCTAFLAGESSEVRHTSSITPVEQIIRLAFLSYEQSMHYIFAPVHPATEGKWHTAFAGGSSSSASAPLLHLLRHAPQQFLAPLYCALAASTYSSVQRTASVDPSWGEYTTSLSDFLRWKNWSVKSLLLSPGRCPASESSGAQTHSKEEYLYTKTTTTSLTTLLRFLAHLLESLSSDGNIPCSLRQEAHDTAATTAFGGAAAPGEGPAYMNSSLTANTNFGSMGVRNGGQAYEACWCRQQLPLSWWLSAEGQLHTERGREAIIASEDTESVKVPTFLIAFSELLLAVATSTLSHLEQHQSNAALGSPSLIVTSVNAVGDTEEKAPYSEYLQQLHWAMKGLSSLFQCFRAHPFSTSQTSSESMYERLIRPALQILRRATRMGSLHHTVYLPLCQWVLECLRQDVGAPNAEDAFRGRCSIVVGELVALLREGVMACVHVLLKDNPLFAVENPCASHRSSEVSSPSLPAMAVSEVPSTLHVWRQCVLQVLKFQGTESSICVDHSAGNSTEEVYTERSLTGAVLEVWLNALESLWAAEVLQDSVNRSEANDQKKGYRRDFSASVQECVEGLSDVLHFVVIQSERQSCTATTGSPNVGSKVVSTSNWWRSSSAQPKSITNSSSPVEDGVASTPLEALESLLPRTFHVLYALALSPSVTLLPNPSNKSSDQRSAATPVLCHGSQAPSQVLSLELIAFLSRRRAREEVLQLFVDWWLGHHMMAASEENVRKAASLKASALLLSSFLEAHHSVSRIPTFSRYSHTTATGESNAGGHSTSWAESPLEGLTVELPKNCRVRRHVEQLFRTALPSFRQHAEKEVLVFLRATGYSLTDVMDLCHSSLTSGTATAGSPTSVSPAGTPKPAVVPASSPTPSPTTAGLEPWENVCRYVSRTTLSFSHAVLPSLLAPPADDAAIPTSTSDPLAVKTSEEGPPEQATTAEPMESEPEIVDVETAPITHFLSKVGCRFWASPLALRGTALVPLLLVLSILRHRFQIAAKELHEEREDDAAQRAAVPAKGRAGSTPASVKPPSSSGVAPQDLRKGEGEDGRVQDALMHRRQMREQVLRHALLSETEVIRVMELVRDVHAKKDAAAAASSLSIAAEWWNHMLLEVLHLTMELLPRQWEAEGGKVSSTALTVASPSTASKAPGSTAPLPPLPGSASTPSSSLFNELVLRDPLIRTTPGVRRVLAEQLPSVLVGMLRQLAKSPVFAARDYRPESHCINALCVHFPVLFEVTRRLSTTESGHLTPSASSAPHPIAVKNYKKLTELVASYFSQSLLPALRYSTEGGSAGGAAGTATAGSSKNFGFVKTTFANANTSVPPVFSALLSTPFSFFALTVARMLLQLSDEPLQKRLYEALLSRAFQPHFFDLSPLLLRQLARLWHTASAVSGFRTALEANNPSTVGGMGAIGTTVSSFLVGADVKQTAKLKAEFLKLFSFHVLSADQSSIASRVVLNSMVILLSVHLREYSTVNTLKVLVTSDGQQIIETPEPSRWNLLRGNPVEQFLQVHVPALVEVWCQAMLLFRCLLWRLDENFLTYLWPVVQPELFHVLQLPFGEAIGGEEMQEAVRILKLEAIKTVDMALTVSPANFTTFRWLFMEIRKVCRDEWHYGTTVELGEEESQPEDPHRNPVAPVVFCGLLRQKIVRDEELMSRTSTFLELQQQEEQHYQRFLSSRVAAQRRSPPLRSPWFFVPPSERQWMTSWEGVAFATRLLLQCYPFPTLPTTPLESRECSGNGCPGKASSSVRHPLAGPAPSSSSSVLNSYPCGWTWDSDEVRNCLLQDFSNKGAY